MEIGEGNTYFDVNYYKSCRFQGKSNL